MNSELLQQNVVTVARRLIGSHLQRTIDGNTIIVKIVETEAYYQDDAASHSYKGRTPRTDVMFGPAGYLYVYFTYGMHYCCNVVTGKEGEGSAVLIRAVEPVEGESFLRHNRPANGAALTNGPAKLCQALAIDKSFNGHRLDTSPLELIIQPPVADEAIQTATRIGISQAKEYPWRFYLKNSAYVSKYSD
jgi:DNA-3-methyladenine glycosylase